MNDQALISKKTLEDRQFEILHHSYRVYWASGEKFAQNIGIEKDEDGIPDWQYFNHNLVFRASGEFKEMCLEDTKKWKEMSVCINTEK